MAQKISYWLLIALILSLGFGQLLRYEYLSVPLYFHDVLVVCILVLQGLTLQVKIPFSLKIFLVGLALSWIHALSLFPVSSVLFPSLYSLRLLAYLALYLSLKSKKILIPHYYFLISGLTALVIGLFQYLLLPDMRVFQYLGWDDHLNRLILPHFDPTFTAVMLALALLSTVSTSSYFLIPLYSLGILLTYSRSVWLSLALTELFFIKNTKVLLISIFLFLICITFWLPKKFGEGTNLLRTYSISSRLQSDLAYVQKYKWDLFLGRGMNTLILDEPKTVMPDHSTSPNNSYLYLLATAGVLGLFGWGMFMCSLYQKSVYKPLLIFFFIASLFNNVMFYPFSLLWVLLLESKVPSAT